MCYLLSSWGITLSTSDLSFYLFIFSKTYVKSQDKAFAAATIQAIGRCATNISEVTDTCLNGLVLLLSNRDGKKPSLNSYLNPYLHFELVIRDVGSVQFCEDLFRFSRDRGGREHRGHQEAASDSTHSAR